EPARPPRRGAHPTAPRRHEPALPGGPGGAQTARAFSPQDVGAQDRPAAFAGRIRGASQIEKVEVEQRIAARPATVFSYLIDPAKFVEWMGIGAQLDPRPGGAFRLDVDGAHFASGDYREVEPPYRILMSWGWEGDPEVAPGSTTVEITLTPDGDGKYSGVSIQVGPPDGQAANLLPMSKIDEIKKVGGVEAAFPGYQFAAKPGGAIVVSFGIPDTIVAGDPDENNYSALKVTYAQGRPASASSHGEVALGSTIAHEFNKKVGDTIDLPVRPADAKPDFVNHSFTVVGVLN